MVNLRTAIDSGFWDQPVSSPQTLEGCGRSIPGQPFPLEISRAGRALRIQQLSLLSNVLPFGIIPSISPTPHDPQVGSLALQSPFLKLSSSNWWLGLVAQLRPKRLISSIIKRDLFNPDFFNRELFNAERWSSPEFKDVAKLVLNDSLYPLALGAYTQFSPNPSTSLLLSTECHGDKKKPRLKFMLFHQLPEHDITFEAALPEMFVDNRKGVCSYWDVAHSLSLDMSSIPNKSGFLYRFGLHGIAGHPINTVDTQTEVPSALIPGLCGKAACSYQKTRDFWRIKEFNQDDLDDEDDPPLSESYDVHLSEPHSALSGIIGATCAAWLIGENGLARLSAAATSRKNGNTRARSRKRSPVSADLFGSLCYTFQHGQFIKKYGDLTRLDARLDICSATALSKGVFNMFRNSEGNPDNTLSSPRLNCIFQQQVAGPIVARVDSRFTLGGSCSGAYVEDMIYSLSYSLNYLMSGKVVAWYSPKRKEGMVELRLSEF
ncbi:Protein TRIGALACTOSYLDIACYLGLYCEROL 4, chloroplastic [Linum perenne]